MHAHKHMFILFVETLKKAAIPKALGSCRENLRNLQRKSQELVICGCYIVFCLILLDFTLHSSNADNVMQRYQQQSPPPSEGLPPSLLRVIIRRALREEVTLQQRKGGPVRQPQPH